MLVALVKVFLQRLKIILQSNKFYALIFLISIAYTLLSINLIHKESKYDINDNEFEVIVTKILYKENQIVIEFFGKETLVSYYNGSFPYKIGDKLFLKGNLKEPNSNTIPNAFNYKRYLYNNNIFYLLEIKEMKVIRYNKNIVYKIKNHLMNRIEKIGINKDYLYAFILGETCYIDKNVQASYQFNGVSHLLAIGSMNITILICGISYLFDKFKWKDYLYIILVSIIILVYIILTDYSVSIIRCGISTIILYINKKKKLGIKYQNIIIFIGSISLFNNPYIIYNLGFQYSYLISLGLVSYSSVIKGCYVKKTLLVSLIAYLIGLPITIYNNYEINLLSIFLNIIYVPIINFIVFPLSIITMFIPSINVILSFFINIIEYFTYYFSKFKVFSFIFSKPNVYVIIIYYLVIVYLLQGIKKRKYWRVLFLVFLLIIHYNINSFIKKTSITFLDVKQGDAITIQNGNEVILIDTGGSLNYDYSNNIIEYLKSLGLREIKYLIITHGDYDHIGSSFKLVNNFKVNNVIFNTGNYNDLELKLVKILDSKSIYYSKNVEQVNIGQIQLYFLNTKEYDSENDNSSVIYFEYNNVKSLFMGDAGIEREKDILEKYSIFDIQILKVGHHGSNTSSSEEFINIINPKTCLISVGKNNLYGHPKKNVLERLDKCDLYRTDINGSIKIYLNKTGYNVTTLNY